MKQFMLLGITLFLFCGLAQAKPDPQLKTIKSVTGKVKTVTYANPQKEIKSELVITDAANNKDFSFIVKNITIIYDSKWQPINLGKIKKNDAVRVKYFTTSDGINEAKSINIIFTQQGA